MNPWSIVLLSPVNLNQERNVHKSSTVYKQKQSSSKGIVCPKMANSVITQLSVAIDFHNMEERKNKNKKINTKRKLHHQFVHQSVFIFFCAQQKKKLLQFWSILRVNTWWQDWLFFFGELSFNQLRSFTIKNHLYSVDGTQGLTRSLFHCSGTCTVHSINVLCWRAFVSLLSVVLLSYSLFPFISVTLWEAFF